MPGLFATFSNARDPLRGSKRPKSQFYGHYEPQIPIFGTSFSANFFSLQNMGLWGVQSDVMWCQVLMQPFQTQGTPSEARNGKKKLILGPFWTPNPVFWPFWVAEWVPWVCHVTPGPYAAFSNPGDRISGSEWPKSQFFGNFGPQIPIFGHLSCWVGPLSLKRLKVWNLKICKNGRSILIWPKAKVINLWCCKMVLES